MSPDSVLDQPIPEAAAAPRSRRSLLAAAMAGLAGAAAAALGRPAPTRAAAGDPLVIGLHNYGGTDATRLDTTSSGGAFWMTQFGSGSGVRSDSVNGHGGVFTTAHQDRFALQAQHTAATAGAGAAISADGGKNPGLNATTASGSSAITAINSGTAVQPSGVNAYGTYAGVHASGSTYGLYASGTDAVYGVSNSGRGINGYSSVGTGVQGFAGEVNTHASAIGVYGYSASDAGTGVSGQATSGSGTTYGVRGSSSSPNGYAVYGFGPGVAIYGISQGQFGVGVQGTGSGSSGHGLAGSITSDSATASGVYGASAGSNSYAGYFEGKVSVTGALSKGGGSFRIDHPLDPANRILQHSFVESPDMLNVYSGVVTADASGEATVELPGWFDALNRDIRYSLTAIGAPMPSLHVKTRAAGGSFALAGAEPRGEVSWQLTGIRQDAWADANRIEVEIEKTGRDRGRFLHPLEHGQPASKGIDFSMRQQLASHPPEGS
jgi:hypothetical protein